MTQGPGLVGSLLVGVAFAKTFAWARGIPVIPVHHLAGHIESLTLAHGELPLPATVLVVSGGHTSLYLVPEPGVYRLVGRTRDDAAGEAYDKVAKLLGLGYPGGPVLDRLARTGREDRFSFPATRLTHANRFAPRATGADLLPPELARRTDFSFSGLKTAVLRLVQERSAGLPPGSSLPEQDVADICASFQRVVVGTLLDRTFEVARVARRPERGDCRRRVGQQPVASGRRGSRRAAGPAGLCPADRALDRQRGHDWRRRPAPLPRRHRRHLGVQRRSILAALRMKTFTDYLWFTTKQRQEFVRITDEVAAIVKKSGVDDGMVLVSASHITAGVYVNDWEDGLIADFKVWLEKLAPAGLPYKHHQTGEDNADAHLKRTIMGHQVMVPITNGKLDLGPWEQIFYAEFDGQRRKRVVVKVMGQAVNRESGAQGWGRPRRPMPTDREYPARPIVGVGAVILVSPAEARAMGWAERLEGTGIVLVKRRFEPLAGQWSLPGGTLEVGETLDGGHCARDRGGNRADGRRRRDDRGLRSHLF